jgi:hypothetical protein
MKTNDTRRTGEIKYRTVIPKCNNEQRKAPFTSTLDLNLKGKWGGGGGTNGVLYLERGIARC